MVWRIFVCNNWSVVELDLFKILISFISGFYSGLKWRYNVFRVIFNIVTWLEVLKSLSFRVKDLIKLIFFLEYLSIFLLLWDNLFIYKKVVIYLVDLGDMFIWLFVIIVKYLRIEIFKRRFWDRMYFVRLFGISLVGILLVCCIIKEVRCVNEDYIVGEEIWYERVKWISLNENL